MRIIHRARPTSTCLRQVGQSPHSLHGNAFEQLLRMKRNKAKRTLGHLTYDHGSKDCCEYPVVVFVLLPMKAQKTEASGSADSGSGSSTRALKKMPEPPSQCALPP